MDHFDGGEVLFDGKSLSGCPEKEIGVMRLFHMGFIFQKTNFLKNLSIEDNIIFPAFQAKGKIFGDEPTGALNSAATEEVMSILGDIHKKGTTVMLVTHDEKVAMRADRVIYLEDGRIKNLYQRENAGITLGGWLEKLRF